MPTYQFSTDVKFNFEIYAQDKETALGIARSNFYINKGQAFVQSQELENMTMTNIEVNPTDIKLESIIGEF